jgi:hypothetical protein
LPLFTKCVEQEFSEDDALNEMSDGVAHATLTYAEDEEVFVGRSNVEPRSSAGVYKEFKGLHARR